MIALVALVTLVLVILAVRKAHASYHAVTSEPMLEARSRLARAQAPPVAP